MRLRPRSQSRSSPIVAARAGVTCRCSRSRAVGHQHDRKHPSIHWRKALEPRKMQRQHESGGRRANGPAHGTRRESPDAAHTVPVRPRAPHERGSLMPRRVTGEINERVGKRGISYQLRFTAYGRREPVTLRSWKGWTRERAEIELANILADVRRGTWRPNHQRARTRAAGRSDLPRVLKPVDRGPRAPRRAHDRGLHVGAHQPPAAVLRGPPAIADHGR